MSRRHRRLGDMLAQAYVVRVRDPAAVQAGNACVRCASPARPPAAIGNDEDRMYCAHNLVTGVAAFVAAAAITFHADLVVGEEVGNDLCPAHINSQYLHTAELLSRSDREGVKFVCKYSDNTVRVLTLPPGCSLPNAVASIADDFRHRVAMHVYTCTQTEAEPDRCVLSCDRHLRDAIASCRREEEALERIEGSDATARRKLSDLRASLTCKWLEQSVDAAISTAVFDALNRELELEGCFVGAEPPGSNGAHTFKNMLMAQRTIV